MLNRMKIFGWLFVAAFLLSASACSNEKDDAIVSSSSTASSTITLDVYKRASCGCCNKWIDHIQANGLSVNKHNENDLAAIKEKYGIQPKWRSCHTAVTQDGYVFEGHIPAKYIKKFLADIPAESKGLSVPAMPTGTPGMEFGDLLQPYKIYLLKTDGSIEVYAEVNTAQEQI